MARKIFVSYKYGDSDVPSLPAGGLLGTTARHYVDVLQAHLDANDHINKGENDGESLEGFHDDTIASKLRDKIYDSSITLVLISKNMKDVSKREEDQWIPWEVSYSLREKTRDGRTSAPNAVLAIVLPDSNGSYQHFIQDNTCTYCGCKTLQTHSTFKIIRDNMFNHSRPVKSNCAYHPGGNQPYLDAHSYIHTIKWSDFISNVNVHLDNAMRLNQNIGDYRITKELV